MSPPSTVFFGGGGCTVGLLAHSLIQISKLYHLRDAVIHDIPTSFYFSRPPQHPVTDYVVTMQELSKHQSISSTLTRMSVKCINQIQINNLIHLLKHTNIRYLKYHERLRKDDDESDLWRTLTSHCGSLRELRLVRSISRVQFQRHIEENMLENEKRQWEERVVVS